MRIAGIFIGMGVLPKSKRYTQEKSPPLGTNFLHLLKARHIMCDVIEHLSQRKSHWQSFT